MNDTLDLSIRLIATVVLIGINALYVFHEFAYVTLKPTQIRKLDKDQSKSGRLVSKAAHKLDHYIAVDQLGITVSSLAVGWIGQPAVTRVINALFGNIGLSTAIATVISAVLAFTLITGTQMVVGELMPKTYALRHPESTARWTASPVELTAKIFHPFVLLLNGIGLALVRLLGFKGTGESHAQVLPADELVGLVRSSARAGLLTTDPAALNRLLHFSDLKAHDLMVPRPDIVAIPLVATHEEMLQIIREHQHDRFPVYEESVDHVVGMINVKSLLASGMRSSPDQSTRWQQHVRPIPTIPESATIEALLMTLEQSRQQMVLLVDEFGATEGIVTVTDITQQLISGPDEITSETSESYLVDGHTSLGILESELGIQFDDDERNIDTIAGLILSELGKIPGAGDAISISGHRIEVVEMDGNRITNVRIWKTDESIRSELDT